MRTTRSARFGPAAGAVGVCALLTAAGEPFAGGEPPVVQASASTATQTLTFGRPVVSGINGIGYEQNLRIDPQGNLYSSVPDGAPSGGSFVWHSIDKGRTFKPVAASLPLTNTVPESCAGGGGDTELAVDSAGNLYFNDLTVANFSTARSSDQGRTLAPTHCLSVPGALVDRQWYAVDGNPTAGGKMYMAYDGVAQGNAACPGVNTLNNVLELARSPAAGDPTGVSAGVLFAPAASVTAPCMEGIMGNVEVSPTTHHVFAVHDDTFYQQIRMARCVAVAFTADPSGLNCTDTLISSFPHAITAANFPSLAIDRAGTLYAVWERAPCQPCGFDPTTGAYIGLVTGDTMLYLSTSSDDGATWSAPVQLSTPGLHNNVFASIAAGDAGRFDIAWYGTGATETPPGAGFGPDSTNGDWSLYVMQSLNGGSTYSAPVVASEHFIHRGTIQTLLGGQQGDRNLGDFLQLRIGKAGEADISYADSNNIDEALMTSQATFVRQVGGPSVSASHPTVKGKKPAVNGVVDPSCDATLDSAGTVSANLPSLDILASRVAKPDPTHYLVTVTVADLTSLAPPAGLGLPGLVWQTQWHVPVTAAGGAAGGHIFFAYMEATDGGAPTFWDGESASTTFTNGGNGSMTYPGAHQITGSYTATSPGTISITVPAADVSDAAAVSETLFSVTASTLAYPAPANSVPVNSGIGGVLFDTIDVSPAYDFLPGKRDARLSLPAVC